MIHTRRQIDIDKCLEEVRSGKYANAIGPSQTHPGPGYEGISFPQVGYAEVYQRKVGEGWMPVPNMGDNSVDELSRRPLLRSKEAYWDAGRPDIIAALKLPPELLSREDLIDLIRELDRRFVQLNDKVSFESKHKLVDYSKLPAELSLSQP